MFWDFVLDFTRAVAWPAGIALAAFFLREHNKPFQTETQEGETDV